MSECSRREFVVSLVVAGGALAVAPRLAMADDAPVTPPAAGAAVIWANVGPVSGFSATWKLTKYPEEFGKQKAFVKVVDGKTVTALSRKCPHQGCNVAYDDGTKDFLCPCHSAKFDVTGAVISGPATSPLATLQSKIDGGNVFVQSLAAAKPAA